MAALATQNVGAGGAVTTAAAAGGGDTIEVPTGAGGWLLEPIFLYATVSTTATTITVGGVAFGPYTSQTVVIPIIPSAMSGGGSVAITYSQVTGVAVGSVGLGAALD